MKEDKLTCPFNSGECSSGCALYISPDELNEVVRNKLASVGVINREKGFCSFKNISMCLNREIFERTSNYLR
ncbi:MAG: hypothetical protein WCG23_12015 [bacterium]